jgi:predicted deacylase
MSTAKTRIACDIDFDKPGLQYGSLRLPHSDNRHAYGYIPVPIAQIKSPKQDGPTVLICAGNHGDEYEGQIVIRRLLSDLKSGQLQGRLLLMPALNYPAVKAGQRVSPLDDGNMNRAFPGEPDGGPTAAIAHFVDSVILPQCDVVIDLHSGGIASEFLPCVYLYHAGDAQLWSRKLDACRAFGLPYTVLAGGNDRSLSYAAERHGCLMLATELAGAGTVRLDLLDLALQGLLRVLHQCGLLPVLPDSVPSPTATQFCKSHDAGYFVASPCEGLFEPACILGDAVSTGQVAGWVHALDELDAAPRTLHFEREGIVICRRIPAQVQHGDYVFHLGAPVPPEVVNQIPDERL